MEFIPEAFWASHAEAGQRKMVVAQENLKRLLPEVFEEVVFLEEYRQAEEPEGAA